MPRAKRKTAEAPPPSPSPLKKSRDAAPAPLQPGLCSYIACDWENSPDLLSQLVREDCPSQRWDSHGNPVIVYEDCGLLAVPGGLLDLKQGTRIAALYFAWAISKLYFVTCTTRKQRPGESDEDYEDTCDTYAVYGVDLTYRLPRVIKHTIRPKREVLAEMPELDKEEVVDDDLVDAYDKDDMKFGRVVLTDVTEAWKEFDGASLGLSSVRLPPVMHFALPPHAPIGVVSPQGLVAAFGDGKTRKIIKDLLRALWDGDHLTMDTGLFPEERHGGNLPTLWWAKGNPALSYWALDMTNLEGWERDNLGEGWLRKRMDEWRPLHFELHGEQPSVCYSAHVQLILRNPVCFGKDFTENEMEELVHADVSGHYGTNRWKM